MPKLGDIVTLNMCHENDNEPCAAIVVRAKDDGSVSVFSFPANGMPPTFNRDVPARTAVDETFLSYGDPEPVSEPVTLPDGSPLGGYES